MSNLQSPQILSDLYRDLRDRRLLPLVIVLVVGMAVVPIALSSSPEATPAPPPPVPVAAKSDAPTEAVVVANPGLRDYKKRLAGDAPKDPFIQKFLTSPSTGSAAATGSTGGSTGETSPAGTETTTSGASTGASTGGSTTTQQPQTQSKFFFYRAKVRSGQLGEELKVHDSIGSLAALPSKQVPALSFLGVNLDSAANAKSAVFLVSSEVSTVSGEGHCTSSGPTCQLLVLKPGQHEDVVWSDGLTYRIDLVNFKLISRNSLPSVGNNGSKSGSGGSSTGRSSQKQAKHTDLYFSF